MPAIQAEIKNINLPFLDLVKPTQLCIIWWPGTFLYQAVCSECNGDTNRGPASHQPLSRQASRPSTENYWVQSSRQRVSGAALWCKYSFIVKHFCCTKRMHKCQKATRTSFSRRSTNLDVGARTKLQHRRYVLLVLKLFTLLFYKSHNNVMQRL